MEEFDIISEEENFHKCLLFRMLYKKKAIVGEEYSEQNSLKVTAKEWRVQAKQICVEIATTLLCSAHI
jgi:hypothetical protein